ncbi:hypothetical protein [Escherichia phage vB_EcoM-LTH01]
MMISPEIFVTFFIMVSLAGSRFLPFNVLSATWFILGTIFAVETTKYFGGSY